MTWNKAPKEKKGLEVDHLGAERKRMGRMAASPSPGNSRQSCLGRDLGGRCQGRKVPDNSEGLLI